MKTAINVPEETLPGEITDYHDRLFVDIGRHLAALQKRLEVAAVRLVMRLILRKESPAIIGRRVLGLQRRFDFWKQIHYGACP